MFSVSYDLAVIQLEDRLIFGPNIDKIDMLDEDYVPKTMDEVTIFGY